MKEETETGKRGKRLINCKAAVQSRLQFFGHRPGTGKHQMQRNFACRHMWMEGLCVKCGARAPQRKDK